MGFIRDYWFLISGVVIPILSYVIGKYQTILKKQKEDMLLIKNGMCSLQRDALLKACEKYRARGFCPMEAKETLNEMYISYHALGGNSFITEMIRQINLLPEHESDTN
jgi:hypothetical protein